MYFSYSHPFPQVLLWKKSRFINVKCKCYIFDFSKYKRAVVVELGDGGGGGEVVRLVGVHLTSSHQAQSAIKRLIIFPFFFFFNFIFLFIVHLLISFLPSSLSFSLSPSRVRQIGSILNHMYGGKSPPPNVSTVMLGDFNINSADKQSEQAIPSHFVDCWKHVWIFYCCFYYYYYYYSYLSLLLLFLLYHFSYFPLFFLCSFSFSLL